MIFYDDLDDCVIGGASPRFKNGTAHHRVVYSGDKLLEHFKKHGLDYDEAMEYVEFNIEGGYLGEHTPIIMWEADADTLRLLFDTMEESE